MSEATRKTCNCGKDIARTRTNCGAFECKAAESAAWLATRRARRDAKVRPTSRGTLSPATRRAIHERDGWTCHLCAHPIDPGVPYPDIEAAVVDHIVPLASGGTNDPSNLASAHSFCNASKGRKPLDAVV